jgi:hypothetical protein
MDIAESMAMLLRTDVRVYLVKFIFYGVRRFDSGLRPLIEDSLNGAVNETNRYYRRSPDDSRNSV